MTAEEILDKFKYLKKEDANELSKFIISYKERSRATYRAYKNKIDEGNEKLRIEVRQLKSNEIYRQSEITKEIRNFIKSEKVQENVMSILEPNCKDRDFKTGYYKAILDINKFIQSSDNEQKSIDDDGWTRLT